jgi:hypothetical protein
VVLFCHGGVWAAGAKWHYSPMGSTLAQLGIVTCVMQYTLYPDALVPQLVEELSQCLDWVQVGLPAAEISPASRQLASGAAAPAPWGARRARRCCLGRRMPRWLGGGAGPWPDAYIQLGGSSAGAAGRASSRAAAPPLQANIGAMGGDTRQLTLVGHSAGAHLCALLLLDRARAAHEQQLRRQRQEQQREEQREEQQEEQQAEAGPGRQAQQIHALSAANSDETASAAGGGGGGGSSSSCGAPPAMPACFVGLAGVYDISQHYEYERRRGTAPRA